MEWLVLGVVFGFGLWGAHNVNGQTRAQSDYREGSASPHRPISEVPQTLESAIDSNVTQLAQTGRRWAETQRSFEHDPYR